MKSLKQLNNVERAKLLFQLIPEHMPALVKSMGETIRAVVADPEPTRKAFGQNPIVHIDTWLMLIAELNAVFIKDAKPAKQRLHLHAVLFSEELFSGWLAMVSTSLVAKYADNQPDEQFKNLVHILFDFK